MNAVVTPTVLKKAMKVKYNKISILVLKRLTLYIIFPNMFCHRDLIVLLHHNLFDMFSYTSVVEEKKSIYFCYFIASDSVMQTRKLRLRKSSLRVLILRFCIWGSRA